MDYTPNNTYLPTSREPYLFPKNSNMPVFIFINQLYASNSVNSPISTNPNPKNPISNKTINENDSNPSPTYSSSANRICTLLPHHKETLSTLLLTFNNLTSKAKAMYGGGDESCVTSWMWMSFLELGDLKSFECWIRLQVVGKPNATNIIPYAKAY